MHILEGSPSIHVHVFLLSIEEPDKKESKSTLDTAQGPFVQRANNFYPADKLLVSGKIYLLDKVIHSSVNNWGLVTSTLKFNFNQKFICLLHPKVRSLTTLRKEAAWLSV